MTNEQKQKYREAKKQYKITDEQKQKYREAKKRYRENMTDEQKQKLKTTVENIIKSIMQQKS